MSRDELMLALWAIPVIAGLIAVIVVLVKLAL